MMNTVAIEGVAVDARSADRTRVALWVVDIAVVFVVLIVSGAPLVKDGSGALGVGLTCGLVVPLLLRRHAPRVVFAVVAAVALAQWIAGPHLVADIALLVALYSVATVESLPTTAVAFGIVEVGAVLAIVRWDPRPGFIFSAVFLTGLASAAAALGSYQKTRRAYVQQLRERAERLERERDQQGALAAAAERARIAREMHDIVAHHLTVMVALSEGAARSNATNTEAATNAIRQVSAVGREALNDTRRLLGVLHSDSAEPDARGPLPGLSDIDALVGTVREAGLPVVLTVEGRPGELPAGLPLAAYRIVQEALTNVLKHADAPTQAMVTVRHTPLELWIEVSDDGRSPAAAGRGRGLVGMTERARAWGGKVESGPLAVDGWRVRAVLPLEVMS